MSHPIFCVGDYVVRRDHEHLNMQVGEVSTSDCARRRRELHSGNRWPGDRTNFPQRMAHSFVNDKLNMLWANGLLQSLIARI